jgi:hypothetical protein
MRVILTEGYSKKGGIMFRKIFRFCEPKSSACGCHGAGATEAGLRNDIAKLNSKLKRERELRVEMSGTVNRAKAEMAEISRKYRDLLERTGGTERPDNDGEEFNSLLDIAKNKLDGDEVRAKINSYHASLDKKGYDHVWRERLDLIIEVLATGEKRLPRVLAQVRRAEERKRKMGLENRTWVVNDELVELPWCPAASAYRSCVFEAVMDCVRPSTTKIIETGSGWGEHLCNIFLEGGPIDAGYYSLEMEEEGRKCSLLLGALDPQLKMEAHFFDYLSPDYSSLPKDDGHTILLTAHSIEQVAEIHPDCIYKALQLGKEVSGVHFEPVGWQTYPEDQWTEISKIHRQRCNELKYNRNFWKLLCKIQDEGLIKIKEMKTNFIGLDYNPATYISWEKVI